LYTLVKRDKTYIKTGIEKKSDINANEIKKDDYTDE